jgi:flagellin-specific chaperone FliS
MNHNYGKAANNYLIQEISGSSPEHIMFMLLEGAQRFLLQAVIAVRRRDITTRARMVNRVSWSPPSSRSWPSASTTKAAGNSS